MLDGVIAGDYTDDVAGKLEAKARRNPGGLRVDEVIALAEQSGFACRRSRRGHWICRHPQLTGRVGIAEPHGDERHVKPVYVRDLLAAIDQIRERSREETG